MSNVDEIRDRVILGEFGVKNVCITSSAFIYKYIYYVCVKTPVTYQVSNKVKGSC